MVTATTNSLNSIASTPSTTATSSSTTSSGSGSSTSSIYSTFINLLTTQLKNQDPTNPTDTTQFTNQLISLSNLEQQTQSNSLLQQLVTNSNVSQISSASSFVGTNITASGSQVALTNGTANFGYSLPSAAGSVQVSIKDSNGVQVYSGQGTVNSGNNTVSWNGQNSITGATEPDGVYSISVTAKDATGNSITATPFITGVVTSASINQGVVDLNIGSLVVPESNVIGLAPKS